MNRILRVWLDHPAPKLRQFFLFLVTAVLAAAQTTVYLKSGGPYGFIPIGASTETPAVVQTYAAHGLNVGDTVTIWGVGASVSGSCVWSNVNGIRQVAAVQDATHFSITDLNGNNITATGAWCAGGNPPSFPAAAVAGGGKLTAYTPIAQPRGWLDGPTGTVMRKLALGTNNGLTSLVVASNVATATTSYNHGMNVGDKLGIWGSGMAAFNNSGNPYTVTAVTANTFQFTTSGVANGTYSNSNNTCGPSANQDCLRISQLAYTGNIWWNQIVAKIGSYTSTSYKHVFDGGTIGGGSSGNFDLPRFWAAGALWSLVDPTNTIMQGVAQYCVNHAERFNGVSFTSNETMSQGGDNDGNDFASFSLQGLAMCYAAARPYLNSTQIQTFASKIYNSLEDTTNTCSKTRDLPQSTTLATGTAQAVTSTSITLAASDTAASGYYVNNVIAVPAAGSTSFGLITAFNSATKVAAVASWSAGTPSSGQAYAIYATMTVSSAASGTATVTGYNTNFAAMQVGDAIVAGNTWSAQSGQGIGETESYITAINSATSLTVINGGALSYTASTTVPSIAWWVPQWQVGDCGLRWMQNHWPGAPVLPSQYPPNGGTQISIQAGWGAHQQAAWGGNNGNSYYAGWLAMDLALSDDDPRAVTHLAATQEQWWDYEANFEWNYQTGFAQSGSEYSLNRDYPDLTNSVLAMARSVPSFPMPDLSAWAAGIDLQKIYTVYPDLRYDASTNQHQPRPVRYGTENPDPTPYPYGFQISGWHMDPGWFLYPNSVQAQMYMSWAKTYACCFYAAPVDLFQQTLPWGLLGVDPRIRTASWTQQPTQYLFQQTAQAACQQSGWNLADGMRGCSSNIQGQALISRGPWNTTNATHVLFEARSYWSDHDDPEGGSLRLYKVGHLLNSDTAPPGAGQLGQIGYGEQIDTMPMFGGVASLNNGQLGTGRPASAYMARWASGNHGTWSTAYGDASSRYAYAMADLSGMYTTTYNRVQRHFVHFKEVGTEEIIVQMDDIDASNAPTQVEEHIHYAQNGETSSDCYNGTCYPEGNTTCPGAGGCAGLNSSRLVQSLEDGGTTGQDPARTYGIITQFFSPGTIFVRDDASSYPNSSGHTHRVSLCGGSACGSIVSRFEAVVVHKIASSLSDTTLTAKTLNPDPNWVAVETTDASGNGGKVAAFARNGQTPFQWTFQTDHPGTAQYLIAGLQGGYTYRIYRTDTRTDARVQAVAPGDNSLYFEGQAGSYAIFPQALSTLFLRAGIPAAQAGAAFSYQFQPAGNTDSFQWSVTAGALPAGLSLSVAGVLSGRPAAAGTATFTVTATSAAVPAVTLSAPFTLEVQPPPITLTLTAAASNGAILRYGSAALDALQPCTVTVSTQPDFSTTLESFADAGGAGSRWYVAGSQTALQPATTYYAQASCGALLSAGTLAFATAPVPAPGSASIPVSVAPPRGMAVAAVEVQYGTSPQLGAAVTVPCPGACTAVVPAAAGTIVYLRRLYLDAASHVLASSSVTAVATGAQ